MITKNPMQLKAFIKNKASTRGTINKTQWYWYLATIQKDYD